MTTIFSQDQYSALFKNKINRHINVKITLLNEQDYEVASLEGIAIDGNVSLQADRPHRRAGSLTMILNNNQLIPSPSSKIWFNKRLKLQIGLTDLSDKIVWFDLGRFAIDKCDLNLSSSEKTISLNLLDYMAFLDGTLGGRLSHETLITSQSTPVDEAIRTIVNKLGKVAIENIIVNGSKALVPYEIRRDPNSTIYDAVKELVELFMGYEFFFDTEGYFVVRKIADKSTDSIRWDFTQDNMDLAINYSSSVNLSNVKNSIYVWGRELDNGIQIKWVYRNRWSRNNYSDLVNLTDKQKGDICHILSENNSYVYNGSTWQLLDFKVIPEFNIEKIGEKIWAYNDSNIYDEEQAKLRAEYELKNYSNVAEQINISCVPIYLLDVNQKIKIQEKIIGADGEYLTQQINIPLKPSEMSISGYKLYY